MTTVEADDVWRADGACQGTWLTALWCKPRAAAAPGELAVDVALARGVRAQLRQPRVVLLLHAWRPACMAKSLALPRELQLLCSLLGGMQ